MKKNGFIATSLIYSFFLIFITLFLGIIADYLQNRVLLNKTESSIKLNLNKKISIKDVNVGDLVGFSGTSCTNTPKEYVVVNVINNDSAKCTTKDGSTSLGDNCLILYSIKVGSYSNTNTGKSILEYADLELDIDSAHRNGTYYDKLLYTLDGGVKEYNFGDDYYVTNNSCPTTPSTFDTSKGCIKTGAGSSVNRERYVYNFKEKATDSNNDYILELCEDLSGSGTFYLKAD